MTINSSLKQTLRRGAVAAFLAFFAVWLVMEACQWTFRMRAEALLSDIKSLDVNRSSWSDAQRLMTRWGKWGQWYGSCDSEDCNYNVRIPHLSLVYPAFLFGEGPHFGTRLLELIGLRSAAATAEFRVVHGTVINKGFGIDVALPVSHWIVPEGGFWLTDRLGSTYWPSLEVAFSERTILNYSNAYSLAKHPNRSIVQRRIQLLAEFTPEESTEEQSSLTDFRFDCITRWTACSSRRELLPKAEEEFETDLAAER